MWRLLKLIPLLPLLGASCPAGRYFRAAHDTCVPCTPGTYNHGTIPRSAESCYTVRDREIQLLNATDVSCAPHWHGRPQYEDGEYNGGCIDKPDATDAGHVSSTAPDGCTDAASASSSWWAVTASFILGAVAAVATAATGRQMHANYISRRRAPPGPPFANLRVRPAEQFERETTNNV